MKAIIQIDVPDHQIGQEVSIYFKDTMMIKGIVQESSGDLISRQATLEPYKVLNDTDTLCVALIRANIMQQPSVNPQEPSRDMEEIAEILRCDADAETKCKMISNILTAKPHYFEELRDEITTLQHRCYALTKGTMCVFCGYECKYKAESEEV